MSTTPERPEGPRARDPLLELNLARLLGNDDTEFLKEFERVSYIIEKYIKINQIKFYEIIFDEPGEIGYPLEPIFLISLCEAIATEYPSTVRELCSLDDVGIIDETPEGKLVQNPNWIANYNLVKMTYKMKERLPPREYASLRRLQADKFLKIRLVVRKDMGKISNHRRYEENRVNPMDLTSPAEPENESQSGWNWKTYIVVGMFIGWVAVKISEYYKPRRRNQAIEEMSKDIDDIDSNMEPERESEPLSDEMTDLYSPCEGFLDFPKMLQLLTFLIIPFTIFLLYKYRYYFYYKYILRYNDKYNKQSTILAFSKTFKKNNYIYIQKRTMLTMAVKARPLTLLEKTIIAKSSLNFVKTITNTEVSDSLAITNALSSKKVANETLTKGFLNYISSESTPVINTNMSAAILTNIELPLEHVCKVYSNTKIIYPLQNKNIPIRCAVEYPFTTNFLNRFDTLIENVVITADTIAIPGRTTNINRDLILKLKRNEILDTENIVIDKDIKAGKIDLNAPLSGHIRQIHVFGNEIVSYPNDLTTSETLHSYYFNFLKILKRAVTLDSVRKSISDKHYQVYKQHINYADNLVRNSKDILKDSSFIEQEFMKMQTLTKTINFSFINIYEISDKALTHDEMKYLNRMIEYINPDVLRKESFMRTFIIEALKHYHSDVDPKAIRGLKSYVKYYPWLKNNLLGIDVDFFMP